MIKFNPEEVPFSIFGSYMCFSVLPKEWGYNGLVMRTMRNAPGMRELLHIFLIKNGLRIDYRVDARPWVCSLVTNDGQLKITFANKNCVRIRGESLSLKFESVPLRGQYAFAVSECSWILNSPPTATQYLITLLRGQTEINCNLEIDDLKRDGKKHKLVERKVAFTFAPDEFGIFELALEEFITTPNKTGLKENFQKIEQSAKFEWMRWLDTMPAVSKRYLKTAELAMYVNYESVVAPYGNLSRNTLLMSKNWMTSCWSWDHCFNAIALAYKNPDLAWDQLNIFFDLQDDFGCLPDAVSATSIIWNFSKPPIYGWTFSRMMEINKKFKEKKFISYIFPKLAKWTIWWLKNRDFNSDGLCEYHHGNDSGWDNASVFDLGFPVTAPDLATYLIIQMELLSKLAIILGKKSESKKWQINSDKMLKKMIEKLWDGNQFQTKNASTGEISARGDSLINYVPILIGDKLPAQIRNKIASELKIGGRFVTKFGPATENPRSKCYVDNGYWRGPVWAPIVLLITDGLRRSGFQNQAKVIAKNFCEMCRTKMTFAENYDPLNGKPLCDKAYTWSSSVFLILAHELNQ
ncbi:MAG TPA: trehalase family glycosidase [Victivallales bacterium]|nr:trehalase family glycosidase [Victivallales bacterium]HPO90334.1 trehalase family glycosidase [Victivallales bacterium]HRR27803.1 trehalase family glycosidase [Victivallales bacterium]